METIYMIRLNRQVMYLGAIDEICAKGILTAYRVSGLNAELISFKRL